VVTRTHITLSVLLITTFCAESVNRGMLNSEAMENRNLRRRLHLPQVYQLLELRCKGKSVSLSVQLASPSGRSIRRSIDSFIYDLSLLSVGAWHVKHGRRCPIIRRLHVHLGASACFLIDILSTHILLFVGSWPCKMYDNYE